MARSVVALVPAAGHGTRFGEKIPKVLFSYDGQSLISRTLRTLTAVDAITSIVVLYPKDYKNNFVEGTFKFGSKVHLVAGGASRQESVWLGLEYARTRSLLGDDDVVIVHDAARSFASQDLFRRTIAACHDYRAVTCAIAVTDSLVFCSDGVQIGSYVDRSRHFLVQTPQAFHFGMLYKAHLEAQKAKRNDATDDASLLLGQHPVHIIEGERQNVKVTVRGDLYPHEGNG